MKPFPVAIALAFLAALVPATLATHATETFVATGHIALPNPTSDVVGGVSENGHTLLGDGSADGIDGDAVALPPWAPGHPLSVTGSTSAPYDLDVWFYDGAGAGLGSGAPVDATDDGGCAGSDADEACIVPAGAATAVVDLWLGADVDFTLTVTGTGGSPPPPPLDGFVIPMFGPFTWDHADLTVVIVPSTAAAALDQDLTPAPEGAGLGPDSAYVAATKDVMVAWESAMDDYVADHPSASYLEALEFDVKVLGVDATVEDYDAADIRIMFSPAVPLGVGVLGVAIATETDDDGRFIQCDVINADWFLFPYTSADMYNIHGQEFGHCLGLSHPEDPSDDIMNGSYDYLPGDAATPRMCVSSLDVRGLEVAYDWLGTTGVWEASPSEIALSADQYERYDGVGTPTGCPN